ncbi:hypothetical protein JCM10908_003128 [Rhodotorula pacifica]|uniref:uncharacterized protein n=1 Tax=Rhodotorula pacifica TaxID=1495444 RepID=UPI00317ACABC
MGLVRLSYLLLYTATICAAIPADSRSGLDGGIYTSKDGLSKTTTEEATWSEVCYVDLYAAKDQTMLRYSKELLTKDATARDVYVSDGYKKDADGKDFYYLEYCYRSGNTKGQTNTNKASSSGAIDSDPFGSIIDNLGIGGTSGNLLSGLAGGSRLVFGAPHPGLAKRQNTTGESGISAIDDLNRVSEALGGPNNVFEPGSDDTADLPGGSPGAAGGGTGDSASDGVVGEDARPGLGLGGNPARRPTSTSTAPKVFSLSTADVQTAVFHSDSRQTPTAAAVGADPFFASTSSFVAATPSLGPQAAPTTPLSDLPSLVASAPASSASSPLTVFLSTSAPVPTSHSLFITVGNGPELTGSVTTVASSIASRS